MIHDLRELEAGTELEADVCIVGGGAAGISIARHLRGSGIRLVLLESGGLTLDAETQALYVGRNVGLPYYPLSVTRLRYLGGSTNHWGGWSRPLDPIDFQARDWVPHSGWPFGLEELEPYYAAAQEVCGLGAYRYDAATWDDPARPVPEWDAAKLESAFFQIGSPARHFNEAYRQELETADDVDVWIYANATRIETDASVARAERVHVRALGGAVASVRARWFVVACGGLENPRLLLLSDDVEPNGLGNRHDLVGRFFMEHPHNSSTAVLHTEEPAAIGAPFERRQTEGVGQIDVRVGIASSPAAQRARRILNGAAFMTRPRAESGFTAYLALRRAWDAGRWPDDLGAQVWSVLADLDTAIEGLMSRRRGEPDPVRYLPDLSVGVTFEQAPNPESRVVLGEERDALGLRRLDLDWRLTELDKRTLRVTHELVGEEFGRLGLGRYRIAESALSGPEEWPETLEGGHHHMGTTRMADDPKRGVVDRDCRVHGVENLYVAGSSVFPTAGHANPTLTLVALALRLAGHLRSRVRI